MFPFDTGPALLYTGYVGNNYISAFTSALGEIFKEIGIPNIELAAADSNGKEYQIVSTVGLTGDIQGYVMLKTDFPCAEEFVAHINDSMGMEKTERKFGEYHKAALSEITNQICGRAMMLLSDSGYDCNITPPTIVTGTAVFTDVLNLVDSSSTLVKSPFGDFNLFIGIKNLKNSK